GDSEASGASPGVHRRTALAGPFRRAGKADSSGAALHGLWRSGRCLLLRLHLHRAGLVGPSFAAAGRAAVADAGTVGEGIRGTGGGSDRGSTGDRIRTPALALSAAHPPRP